MQCVFSKNIGRGSRAIWQTKSCLRMHSAFFCLWLGGCEAQGLASEVSRFPAQWEPQKKIKRCDCKLNLCQLMENAIGPFLCSPLMPSIEATIPGRLSWLAPGQHEYGQQSQRSGLRSSPSAKELEHVPNPYSLATFLKPGFSNSLSHSSWLITPKPRAHAKGSQ